MSMFDPGNPNSCDHPEDLRYRVYGRQRKPIQWCRKCGAFEPGLNEADQWHFPMSNPRIEPVERITPVMPECARATCQASATVLVRERPSNNVNNLCEVHAQEAEECLRDDAEYVEHCPNCGCIFGVN